MNERICCAITRLNRVEIVYQHQVVEKKSRWRPASSGWREFKIQTKGNFERWIIVNIYELRMQKFAYTWDYYHRVTLSSVSFMHVRWREVPDESCIFMQKLRFWAEFFLFSSFSTCANVANAKLYSRLSFQYFIVNMQDGMVS